MWCGPVRHVPATGEGLVMTNPTDLLEQIDSGAEASWVVQLPRSRPVSVATLAAQAPLTDDLSATPPAQAVSDATIQQVITGDDNANFLVGTASADTISGLG